jgi:glucuronate isomerase
LRNPLYHWTHLELKNYFGIEKLLDETTAKSIWEEANRQLVSMPVHEILTRSRVAVSCTTDDPTDTLVAHRKVRDEGKLSTRFYPTVRPDKALSVDQPEAFNIWLTQLAPELSLR